MDIKKYLDRTKTLIDKGLESYLPSPREYPPIIHRAMRHSIFAGGKRFRPILVLASCEVCGGKVKDVLPFACAVELIHTYSLIHDDLPAMDNDDYRRGRLSCHKKFGEAVAILAGDGLLTLAIELMADGSNPKRSLRVIREMTRAVGTRGLIGGQVVDISKVQKSKATLEYIHTHKTGRLISVSTRIGGIAAGASQPKVDLLGRFGETIGRAFQIVDDMLDEEGIFLSIGADRTRRMAEQLVSKAKEEIAGIGRKGKVLAGLADFILEQG